MNNKERKAVIREALGHAKSVPVATPKTECCSHCSLKVGTVGVAPYYPPMAPQPLPANPYGGQYITTNQLYGQNNLQPGNVQLLAQIYGQSQSLYSSKP